MTEEQIEEWRDRKHLIIKDVVRTDRHHPFFQAAPSTISNQEEEDFLLLWLDSTPSLTSEETHLVPNFNGNLVTLMTILMTYVHYSNTIGRNEIGYVQGMSDLCSGLLILFDGEPVSTFWCFVGLMERLHPNFHQNQASMHTQLTTLKSLVQFIDFSLFKHLSQCDALNMFFSYRWFLVWYKREFHLPEILTIWETLLCDVVSDDYAYFIALAIMDLHRSSFFQCTHFDQILKYVNELAYHLPYQTILDQAEIVFQMFRNKRTLVQQMSTRFTELDVELCKKLGYLDREKRGPLDDDNVSEKVMEI
ncbi:GTPase activating protein [Coelomomyces lativittatus]|nr:GTPase activating protein [Coelomomyces lativittatus]